jgi:hypothetical protein
MKWLPIESAPRIAGRYLVASTCLNAVREARWQPKLGKWTFPSAQSSFMPTHWMPLPEPPTAELERTP